MGILLTQRDSLIIGNIAKILGIIMNAIYEILNSLGIVNIGLCIILFTIIFYMLMFPLTIKQQKSSKMMAIMNPEIQAVQKKYANKRDQASMAKMQEEMNLVYEKYGTSPTSGCLGSIIQLPILFALWPVVQNIPAYVNGVKETYMPLVNEIMATDGFQKTMEAIGTVSPINISANNDYSKVNTLVDVLYKFQETTWNVLADEFPDLSELIYSTQSKISEMNYFFGINIAETPMTMFKAALDDFSIIMMIVAVAIPLLAGGTQWLSAWIMQKATHVDGKKKDNENAMVQQMNMMLKIMPIMSIVMCFSMPSGLGIYWISSAVVRTVQSFIVNKSLSKKSIEQIVEENTKKAAKKRKNKNEIAARTVSEMAQKNTKSVRKTTSSNNIESYKQNAKPGSLASKSNMVSDFNKRNK